MRTAEIANAMIDIADRMADLSYCTRRHHGCVLTTTDFRVTSIGFNGPAQGTKNTCVRPLDEVSCGCVHAEANAIANDSAPRGPRYAFITGMPCESCAALLINAGVIAVCYDGETTKGALGRALLEAADVPILRPDNF